MPDTIKTGTILIKDGTFLPDALRFESEPCAIGWRLVKHLDGYGLGRRVHEAGWTFFCLAGEIKATIFGLDVQKTVRRAVKRILANLKELRPLLGWARTGFVLGKTNPAAASRLMLPARRMINAASSRSNQREYPVASMPTRTRIPRCCSSR
jgi:hypothetical protein